MATLPSTYRAVVCHEYGQPLALDTRPIPAAEPGTAIVKVLSTLVDPSEKHRLLLSKRNPYFSQQPPFIPGSGAVGRVAALGKDATSLQVGQLVLLDCFVRGRDDPNAQILRGVFEGPTPAAKKLSHQPENCYPLDEKVLLSKVEQGGLEYGISDLPYLSKHSVAYGGLRSIDLKAGQTIIITPATGNHGGAAVQVASAMGARVIAVGRNAKALQDLKEKIPRVYPVQLTGDFAEDTKTLSQFGTIDAFMDFTPSSMASPLHLKACLAVTKTYGQGVLMGFPQGEISLSYGMMLAKNINIRARYMYDAEDVRGLIKLAERGLLKLGHSSGAQVVSYTLDQYGDAISRAAEQQTWGLQVIMHPFTE
ncbi:hypothetical protein BGW36DRAFT_384430 [Talaromyces proteolyticus]|uniref:Alcohol dehydrogenase-like C-terminal domain-containing protein n=1 Tax=Talaromyces proteolyticus TaxID=1131652 RepID=A0AAD4KRS3_9EURO|nr:uncharacterized protein BGW36DRAFT_384430 [Talaromyces proteolyticus]KAH8694127.1 hypothetical protein BGW36DRAFT_384430 [Talaromyces proteolyticus]